MQEGRPHVTEEKAWRRSPSCTAVRRRQDATVAETLARAAHYVAAGADGVFVPGASEPSVLRELTAAVPVPVNVRAIPALSLGELADLGVRRVSTGSLPYRAALHAAVEVADAVLHGRPLPAATPYPELQDRLARYGDDAPGPTRPQVIGDPPVTPSTSEVM
jgi:2-methylisocitrate lyase-like PEP mutase family enzyme